MEETEETVRKYYLSYTNMMKTIRYRGYDVHEKYDKTREEFEREFCSMENPPFDILQLKENISNLLFYKEEKSVEHGILLVWFKDKKLGVSIRNVVDTMKSNNIDKAIIVADEGVNPGCKEIIKNLKVCYKLTIDVWTLEESMIFVPDHVYVPEHRICTPKEKKKLFSSYNLNKRSLPRIANDDVMVKYLGASKGQLIQIIRKSDTNPDVTVISYRIVI